MSDPIEILMEEHKVVLELLDTIAGQQNVLKERPSEAIPKLRKLIERLDRDFNIHSLNKEEKALFPSMETFMPRDEGPIGVMIQEHGEIVKKIGDFKDGLAAGNYDKVMDAGNYIKSVLSDHIYKEDNILYNMARMHLTTEDMNKIYDKMAEIDREFNL